MLNPILLEDWLHLNCPFSLLKYMSPDMVYTTTEKERRQGKMVNFRITKCTLPGVQCSLKFCGCRLLAGQKWNHNRRFVIFEPKFLQCDKSSNEISKKRRACETTVREISYRRSTRTTYPNGTSQHRTEPDAWFLYWTLICMMRSR